MSPGLPVRFCPREPIGRADFLRCGLDGERASVRVERCSGSVAGVLLWRPCHESDARGLHS